MKRVLALLLAFSWSGILLAQRGEFVTGHQTHIDQLGSAKDSVYQTILAGYDHYIRKNPSDEKAQLERCKFIQEAYYDSYEDYNPNYEEAKACADSLVVRFPQNPEVLLYPAEFMYGDSLGEYLEHLDELVEGDTGTWQNYSWQLYRQLAEYYDLSNQEQRVIQYGELAVARNDTLDLSLLLAESYKELSNKTRAIEVLVADLDSTDLAWELNRKGTLLLELGVPREAMEAFRFASRKGENAEDAGALAKAMIDNGLIQEARDYLLKDFKATTWNSAQTLNALLEYDLTYGRADSAKFTYGRLTGDNFLNDPFGIYRLRLFMKDPFIAWSYADVGRVVLLILLLTVPFILPYLWILPIHYIGSYQKQKGKIFDEGTFKWGLRHFWLASSLWLTCGILADLFFNYAGIISYVNSNIGLENVLLVSKQVANLNIFFFTGSVIFCIALLSREDFEEFLPKLRANAGSIGVGIGLAIALRIGLVGYTKILQGMGVNFETSGSVINTVNDSIISINKFYNPLLGFLFVVILVPFYEEILFRGIFLSAVERNMKFIFANILQAGVFAIVHQDLKYFLFYFAFGLVAGYYTRKSRSLIIGTSMHMMNNMMAFFYILSQQ